MEEIARIIIFFGIGWFLGYAIGYFYPKRITQKDKNTMINQIISQQINKQIQEINSQLKQIQDSLKIK